MNWDLICYLLQNFSIARKQNVNFIRADRVLMLDANASDEENTIYIAADDKVPVVFSKALVIYTGRPDIRSSNYIVLKDPVPVIILNTLLKAKAHLDILSAALSELSDDQAVIDAANAITGAPFFYFDSSYRILAISRNVRFDNDPEWQHMSQKGFLSQESAKRMQESGDLDLLADRHEPIPYNASFYPFSSVVCNIWLENDFYGRLNMLCIKQFPTELNMQECRIICAALKRIAGHNRDRSVFHVPLNNMVVDLLKGHPLSEDLIRDRLKSMPQLLGSLCQVCCIDTSSRNDPQIIKYYISVIQQLMERTDAVVIEYDSRIVLVLHGKTVSDFREAQAILRQFLEDQTLRGGCSNYFHRFNALRDHYLQALALIDFSQTSGLAVFDDLYLDYAVSLLPHDQAVSMISYDIIRLYSLQNSYQFPLIGTLKVYLESGCSLQALSDRLFIHKNTALYRINRIRELMDSDLDDPQVQIRLVLSLKIAEKYRIFC